MYGWQNAPRDVIARFEDPEFQIVNESQDLLFGIDAVRLSVQADYLYRYICAF